ncbi:hypothetical protein TSUD_160550 [Trifolium subterraneum]|uniref:Uncharacterized protein n=1 Tax=Trifolium subterraneum TaxID=3900 RepID=A0A2Z6MS19_TRISU|nr:hypothetical protein TSUD_160550 [Trifolium subterraneum]
MCENMLEEGGQPLSGPFFEGNHHSAIGPKVGGPLWNIERVEVLADREGGAINNKVQAELKLGPSMSENLDCLLKGCVTHTIDKGNINLGSAISDVSAQPDMNGVLANSSSKAKEGKVLNRKAPTRFQSLPIWGAPKCLRFMGAIQSSSRQGKQRQAVSLEEGVVWSAGKLTRSSKKLVVEVEGEGDGGDIVVVSASSVASPYQQQSTNPVGLISRVNGLLREKLLEDVDSFIELKKLQEGDES